ncbi:glycosyltransferase [Microbacterium yannicii]|uniref:glycosyltransferase n=1 Tax=Microbacterium yannicii TaxID=671622 RepID=UPI00058ACDD3|nr:glycosyltransferase [Microbacterium yannicii]
MSVVIPAHDEAAVIERALKGILADHGRDIDVIVAANGCSDETVPLARGVDDRVRVVETDTASKIAALNLGSDAVRAYPVAYVDADVQVAGSHLVALAARLADTPGALVAAPAMQVLPSRSWWVRQYYRVWALTGYRASGHIGSGVYMLSEEGRRRFDRFPDVIADDLFVQRLFSPEERLAPRDLTFAVSAPATLRALIRRNTRIAAGNRQLAERYPDLAPPSGGAGAKVLLQRVWRRPQLWAGFATYCAVYATSHLRARRLLARRARIAWGRDETTRTAGS